jgi:hypothetical protein
LIGESRSGDCAEEDSEVFDNFTVCVDKYCIDELPLSCQGYIDFVETFNEALGTEVLEFEVAGRRPRNENTKMKVRLNTRR